MLIHNKLSYEACYVCCNLYAITVTHLLGGKNVVYWNDRSYSC